MIRAGSTPSTGDHAANLRKALDVVCGHVERASQEGLLITDIKGTRVQSKLGSTVDTFAAALLLAECRHTMPDEPSRKRVVAALDKVMDKVEKNPKEDGPWVDANHRRAGGPCPSLGHMGLKRAAQARKNQTQVETKEIKLRPKTDTHDMQVKVSHARRFLEWGDKVKVTVRFRGRELAHRDIGALKCMKFAELLKDLSAIEQEPRMEGRQMFMILTPTQKPKPRRPASEEEPLPPMLDE
jgi:translation initiation factor IF-3